MIFRSLVAKCALDCTSTVIRSAVVGGIACVGAFMLYKFLRAPRSVRPGINAPFQEGDVANAQMFVERFETESREIFNTHQKVIDLLQVQPGSTVADVGAGTGLFLEGLSRAVGGSGHVYAVDPFDRFISHMRKRLSDPQRFDAELAKRITIVQNQETDLGTVTEGSLDMALAIDTYHHFEYPSLTNPAIFRALKSGGRFIVLDFVREAGISSEWVMGHVRAGQAIVRAEIESAGFVFEEDLKEKAGLTENYLMIFRKK